MNDLRTLLHDLLHDAVDDIEPDRGLTEIQARIKASTGRRWLPVLAAASVVALAAAAGGFWLTQESTTDTPVATHGKPKPSGWFSYGPQPTDHSSSMTSFPVTVPVYFLGSTPAGPRLFREFERVDVETPEAAWSAAARLAVRGDSTDPDYDSVWPRKTRIRSVIRAPGTGLLEVRFAGTAPVARPTGMTAAQARMSLQQLAYTVQGAAQRTTPLVFFSNNRPLHRVLGISIPSVLQRAPASEVLASVSITDPGNGSVVGRTFTVHGQAAAFEANVLWELLQGQKVVRRGIAQTAQCCTLSPYSFTVHAAPGWYTLVVHGVDASGMNRPVPEDTKQISVR